MAKNSTKSKKKNIEKSVEASLWESANKLRGSVEPAEYKHVVLSLIFLKFASDKFEVKNSAKNSLPLVAKNMWKCLSSTTRTMSFT